MRAAHHRLAADPAPVPPRQVRRLIETATALRAGTSTYFAITRLTSIKSLCKQPEVAARFVCYLAERTLERMQARRVPHTSTPPTGHVIKHS